VVSSVRKVWKLPAMVLPSMPVVLDDELVLGGGVVVAAVIEGVMGLRMLSAMVGPLAVL
jgi:hypothetical protein